VTSLVASRNTRRVEVRKATPSDSSALAAVLARAFHDDPVMSWVFPDPSRRVGQAARFFSLRLRTLVPDGEVYTTDGLDGGAVWAVPDRWRVSATDGLRMLRLGLGWRFPRIVRGLTRIEMRHPHEPHYYLAILGTEPSMQGRGVGSALLEPVLASCDADEIPAYLESSKERNVAFYARHGFRVTEELDLPKGPRVWLMWRDPRP
jgi:ribosomal protein S18 acetylase RimI-like enzyme